MKSYTARFVGADLFILMDINVAEVFGVKYNIITLQRYKAFDKMVNVRTLLRTILRHN